MINVLLVTTWGTACGIAEHSWYLKDSAERADPEIRIHPTPELNPNILTATQAVFPPHWDILHLNYHAALHSQWTPSWTRAVQRRGAKVLVTYHDTGVPNSDQAKEVCAAADAFVVHEPYDDLGEKGHYWRQGVPDWASPIQFDQSTHRKLAPGVFGPRPVVGTVGFPFPWKNYDLLCEASAWAGWAVLLIAPGATDVQRDRWLQLNPTALILSEFLDRGTVGSYLAACDATAFLYSCANTGTSGAIRQGIAARKPVLALEGCRQFRDLDMHPTPIDWVANGTVDGVATALSEVILQRLDPRVVALAEQESWTRRGVQYAQLYRSLLP